jgi:hypothetical protein
LADWVAASARRSSDSAFSPLQVIAAPMLRLTAIAKPSIS